MYKSYLSELCIPVSTSAGRHFLRSATYGDLLVPRTSTSTYGPRSFAVSGPSVWNKLPATLHVSPTLGQFQSKLKAVLFRSAYETRLGAFVTAQAVRVAPYKFSYLLTYLLTYLRGKTSLSVLRSFRDYA